MGDDIHLARKTFLGGIRLMQTREPTKENPVIQGSDFAGVVTEIGEGVTNFKVGDRVCGLNKQPIEGSQGPWCEYVVAKAAKLVKLPDFVSFNHATSLVMPYFVHAGTMD